jgi:hypothetical protein
VKQTQLKSKLEAHTTEIELISGIETFARNARKIRASSTALGVSTDLLRALHNSTRVTSTGSGRLEAQKEVIRELAALSLAMSYNSVHGRFVRRILATIRATTSSKGYSRAKRESSAIFTSVSDVALAPSFYLNKEFASRTALRGTMSVSSMESILELHPIGLTGYGVLTVLDSKYTRYLQFIATMPALAELQAAIETLIILSVDDSPRAITEVLARINNSLGFVGVPMEARVGVISTLEQIKGFYSGTDFGIFDSLVESSISGDSHSEKNVFGKSGSTKLIKGKSKVHKNIRV